MTEQLIAALQRRPAFQTWVEALEIAGPGFINLRLKPAAGRSRGWRLLHETDEARFVDIDVQPVLWANHTDTLMHAALDGAGITATTLELAAPMLASGRLVRVLSPWITDRLNLYAALPSRKFMPRRTQVFLDYLVAQTRQRVDQALRQGALR